MTGVGSKLRGQAEMSIIEWENVQLDRPYLGLLDDDLDEMSGWIRTLRKRETWALITALVVLPEVGTGWYSFTPQECCLTQTKCCIFDLPEL